MQKMGTYAWQYPLGSVLQRVYKAAVSLKVSKSHLVLG